MSVRAYSFTIPRNRPDSVTSPVEALFEIYCAEVAARSSRLRR